MVIDGNLVFTGVAGAAVSPTTGVDSPTTGTQQSTNVIDLVNARDMGIGDDPSLELLVQVITTFTGGTSMNVSLQGSVDNSTYTTMWTSPTYLEADLLAGRYLSNITVPRIVLPTPNAPSSAQALPRYLRLSWTSAGTHGAGALYGAIVIDRQDQISYPPGVVIAN